MVVALALTLVAAVLVKGPDAMLRSGGCDTDAPVVGKLAAGTEVEVRSSIAGAGGACYRVSAKIDGKAVVGNVSGSMLSGLEEFDRARQMAAGGESVQVMTAQQVESLRKTVSKNVGGGGPVQQAVALLEQNQAAKALEILGPLTGQGNPDVMTLAGVAAWKADQIKLALEYWKSAQALKPSEQLSRMISRVEKEVAHDKSSDKLIGLRVALRYEGQAMPYATAKTMLEVLDGEVSRVSGIIGCPTHERLIAVVQSPNDYRQGAQAAEWSGGQFDGRIRVPFPSGGEFDARMRRTFAHEVTHACLANMGPWPAWLHEGLAQRLSGESLPAPMREALKELANRKQLPKLQDLQRDWSNMSSENARIAYALALAGADEMVDGYGASLGLRTILSSPALLDRATNEINKRLGLVN
jgi:hypothetical protein